MTETEIEAAIAKNNVELEATKAKIAASITSWPAFLALPWEEQQHLRELIPGRIAELERAHFRNLKGA